MADWNTENVCVLIVPSGLKSTPGWMTNVEQATEKGLLKRHYLRFGHSQMPLIQALAAGASSTKWKVVRKTTRYILVKVSFRPFISEMPPPKRAA